jgi:hypothetical protein
MLRSIRTLFIVFMITAIGMTIPAVAQEDTQAVENGGVMVEGWTGKVDPQEASNGMTLENARLVREDGMLKVITGPTVSYWNPDNTASGNYTVMATFSEPAFMNRSNHPHPYGIFIGGNDMGTDAQTLLYCSTYGNGTFIVRGFGPEPFRVSGNRGEANDAINKAAETGAPVSQEIAVSVTADEIQCSVNGTVVGSYPKSEVVGNGKLKSTDGVYGIRFGHNTEVNVSGLHAM